MYFEHTMALSKYIFPEREELGHSKKRYHPSKTKTQQDGHQILLLHVSHLVLLMELSESKGLSYICSSNTNTYNLSF